MARKLEPARILTRILVTQSMGYVMVHVTHLVEWDDGDALCELASLQQGLGRLVCVNHHLAGTHAGTTGHGRGDNNGGNPPTWALHRHSADMELQSHCIFMGEGLQLKLTPCQCPRSGTKCVSVLMGQTQHHHPRAAASRQHPSLFALLAPLPGTACLLPPPPALLLLLGPSRAPAWPQHPSRGCGPTHAQGP